MVVAANLDRVSLRPIELGENRRFLRVELGRDRCEAGLQLRVARLIGKCARPILRQIEKYSYFLLWIKLLIGFTIQCDIYPQQRYKPLAFLPAVA